jgi:hypothetical protein
VIGNVFDVVPSVLAAIHGLKVTKHPFAICVVRGVKMIVISACNSDL